MMRPAAAFLFCLLMMAPFALAAQRPVELAPNAPRDNSVAIARECQWRMMVQAQEPYVAQARASYPEARQRYLAGLPARQTFFVTVRLADSLMHHEQVFVAVDSIVGTRIVGRIWSDIESVAGYQLRQRIEFPETEIVDWMISMPDGSEQGNVVGKFMDTYGPPRDCREG
ncbi:MAG: hypothetical protein JWO05_999 [Gemmatimonadetes bacterium]|nr:hypothetical protein [Gemmatimonadota bacterium]